MNNIYIFLIQKITTFNKFKDITKQSNLFSTTFSTNTTKHILLVLSSKNYIIVKDMNKQRIRIIKYTNNNTFIAMEHHNGNTNQMHR